MRKKDLALIIFLAILLVILAFLIIFLLTNNKNYAKDVKESLVYVEPINYTIAQSPAVVSYDNYSDIPAPTFHKDEGFTSFGCGCGN